jgi:hypothetical protein
MPLAIYSPNSTITGGAAFFSFNSKEAAIFIKLIKQIANNPDKKGNFDGQNPLHIKLTEDEAGDMIRAVRTNGRAGFYHNFEGKISTGRFEYWEKAVTDKAGKPIKRSGYGLTVSKDGKEIKVSLGLGAAERLSEFLKFALDHIFSAEYAKDKKEFEEWQKKKGAAKPEAAPAEDAAEDTAGAEAAPEEEQEVPF